MHEDVKDFNTLFYCRDCLKCRHYQILHHHVKVLDPIAEPVINEIIQFCFETIHFSTVKDLSLLTAISIHHTMANCKVCGYSKPTFFNCHSEYIPFIS